MIDLSKENTFLNCIDCTSHIIPQWNEGESNFCNFFSILLHELTFITFIKPALVCCIWLGWALMNRMFSSKHCYELNWQEKKHIITFITPWRKMKYFSCKFLVKLSPWINLYYNEDTCICFFYFIGLNIIK